MKNHRLGRWVPFLATVIDAVVLSSPYAENTGFSPCFSLADFIAEVFYWLFLWNFKQYRLNHFLRHSLLFSFGLHRAPGGP